MQKANCDICGPSESEMVGCIEAKCYAPGKKFEMHRCGNCGLVYLPLTSQPDILYTYYPDNYTPHDVNFHRKTIFSQVLMDPIRRWLFTLPAVSQKGCRRAIRNILAAVYNQTAYRSIPPPQKNGKLLDIGCGTGSYLLMMKKIGWEGVGVERNKKAADHGKKVLGLDVRAGLFEDIVLPQKYFDVITMWHSLEHFPSPYRVLTKAGSILKDEGLIIIGIPNYDSLDRRIFGENWNGFEVPLHLYHFTSKTIRKLLESAGFQVEKIIHTVRPADMLKSILNMLSDRCNPDRVFRIRKFLFLPTMLPAILFSASKRSSIIIVQAKKWLTKP